MPTSLPTRRPMSGRNISMFLCWAVALCAASIALEWFDPAPMDVAAAWIVSP